MQSLRDSTAATEGNTSRSLANENNVKMTSPQELNVICGLQGDCSGQRTAKCFRAGPEPLDTSRYVLLRQGVLQKYPQLILIWPILRVAFWWQHSRSCMRQLRFGLSVRAIDHDIDGFLSPRLATWGSWANPFLSKSALPDAAAVQLHCDAFCDASSRPNCGHLKFASN